MEIVSCLSREAFKCAKSTLITQDPFQREEINAHFTGEDIKAVICLDNKDKS